MNIDKMVDRINKRIAKQKVKDKKKRDREDKKAINLFYDIVLSSVLNDFLIEISSGGLLFDNVKTEGIIKINIADISSIYNFGWYSFFDDCIRGTKRYEEWYAVLAVEILENKFGKDGYIFKASADCINWERIEEIEDLERKMQRVN